MNASAPLPENVPPAIYVAADGAWFSPDGLAAAKRDGYGGDLAYPVTMFVAVAMQQTAANELPTPEAWRAVQAETAERADRGQAVSAPPRDDGIRAEALSQSVRMALGDEAPADTVKRAEAFLAFLRGEQ